MRGVLKLLFSRVFIIAVSIIVQLLALIIMVQGFSEYFVFFDIFFTIISLIVVYNILNGKSNPAYKLAWTIPILIFPIFGGLFYLMIGGLGLSKKDKLKMQEITKRMKNSLNQNQDEIISLEHDSIYAENQAKYIEKFSHCPVYTNTTTEYLTPGEELFKYLIEELKKAKRYIFLEFFIIEEGVMWNAILDVLKEKADEGLDVRVIYDDVGCLFKLPTGYNKKLEAMGIKSCVFNPLKPILSVRYNNRDHRKIAVIDGYIAFTGGINLADEYINEYPKLGHWKDSAIFIKGEAVWSLTVMFLSMWNYLRKTEEKYDKFYPSLNCNHEFTTDGYVQPFNDSPLDEEAVSETVYLNLINQAEKYVYIETPYLIIDNKMMTALKMAAKRGVDIRIITPHIPDKWYVHAVSRSNYEDLIEGGVSIYEYLPGFIHSKTFVVDDKYAVVGTINLDYRSLYLHFECAVWLYRTKSVMQVKDDTLSSMKISKQVTLEECKKVPWYRKVGRTFLKIFAPMM